MADYSSLDSLSLRMQASERIFYEINEIRAHMGMPLVQIPCYDNKKQELSEVSRRSQPNSDSNAIPRNVVPARVVPGASLTEGSRDLSDRSSQSDGEVLSLSEVPGTLLNWRADSVRQGRHEVGSKEASTLGSGISFADGFQEVQASAKQLLQALRQTRCDLQEWREEIAGSTQEIDSSKVTQMGGGHTQDSTPEIVVPVEDSTPDQVNTAPAIPTILGTPNDATIDTSIHEIVPGRFVQVEKQFRFNAHHMFDEMPKGKVEAFQHSKVIFVPLVVSKMGCVDSEMVYDDNGAVFAHSIDLIRSRADDGEPNSTDSLGLFVFDPGKRIRFLLHSGVIEALVIFVFDPGISCKV